MKNDFNIQNKDVNKKVMAEIKIKNYNYGPLKVGSYTASKSKLY